MTFQSEKSLSVAITLWGAGLLLIGLSVVIYAQSRISPPESAGEHIVALVTGVLCTLFGLTVILSWFTTRYVLEDNQLIVYAFLWRKRVSFDQIESITQTNTLLSGPALSIKHRLIILHKKGTYTVISPVNQEKFTGLIQEKAPHIRVDS
ncbi:hypothetical protein EWH99_12290 [Sporolactobacillus sp. THM7-7]|nr:hypothetical protein EWH99_12290 [Sporolactobacillus sp. THM7-7]